MVDLEFLSVFTYEPVYYNSTWYQQFYVEIFYDLQRKPNLDVLEAADMYFQPKILDRLKAYLEIVADSPLGADYGFKEGIKKVLFNMVSDLATELGASDLVESPRVEEHFADVQVVPVPIRKDWKTLTVSARIKLFERFLKKIGHYYPLYNPLLPTDDYHVYIFHGTKARFWSDYLWSFKSNGIDPSEPIDVPVGDFSTDYTFYCSNSLQHAFMHVLHSRPVVREDEQDGPLPVGVLVFRVPERELRGFTSFHGEDTFDCKCYTEPDDEWRSVCVTNQESDTAVLSDPLEYLDVVIGPMYNAKTGNAMELDLEDGCPLMQFAFRTKRAFKWLEKYLFRVYLETWTSDCCDTSQAQPPSNCRCACGPPPLLAPQPPCSA